MSRSLLRNNLQLNEYFNALRRHRENCKQLGQYGEARYTTGKLRDLRHYEEHKLKRILAVREGAEISALRANFQDEFETLREKYDGKVLDKYKQHAERKLFQLKEKQRQELVKALANFSRSNTPHTHSRASRYKNTGREHCNKLNQSMLIKQSNSPFSTISFGVTQGAFASLLKEIQRKQRRELGVLNIRIDGKWKNLISNRNEEIKCLQQKFQASHQEIERKYRGKYIRAVNKLSNANFLKLL